MAATITLYNAFRIFGDFHWPFGIKDLDRAVEDKADRRKGVIQIYFGLKDQDSLEAFLRWTPFEALVPGNSVPEDPIVDDVHNKAIDICSISDEEILKSFSAQGKSVAFHLSGSGQSAKFFGPRLLFRGAFLFDQYALLKNNGAPVESGSKLDLRWILARSFQQHDLTEKSIYFFSEVVIGQNGDDAGTGCRIRFNLALPTPGAQSSDNSGGGRCYALPFAVIYKPALKLDSARGPLNIERFIAGPGPAKAKHDGDGWKLDGPDCPINNPQLGLFNFCGGKQASGKTDYLCFPRYNQSEFEYYWPTHTRTFIDDVFRNVSKINEKETGNPFGLKSNPEKDGEQIHNVRFIDSDTSKATAIVYGTRLNSAIVLSEAVFSEDISVAPWSHFEFKVPGYSRKIETKSRYVYVDRECIYKVPDYQIWSLASDKPTPTGEIVIRLGFDATVDKDVGLLEDKDHEPIDGLFDRAIKGMRLARLDLQSILHGEPQSILPEIRVENDEPLRFMLSGKMQFTLRSLSSIGGAIRWEPKFPYRDYWYGLDLNLSLWPGNRLVPNEGAKVQLPVEVSLPSFALADSAKLLAYLEADPNVPSSDGEQHLCQFRLTEREAPNGKEPNDKLLGARIGGLEFKVNGLLEETSDDINSYSHWHFGSRKQISAQLPSSAEERRFWTANVDVRFRLSVSRVIPIAADVPWGDRGDRPTTLLIQPEDPTGGEKFTLDVRETVAEFQDRHLTASIFDLGDLEKGGRDSGVYVILSEEPFALSRFRSQPLQERGTQESGLVATFDSDTRQWQVKLTSPTYHYEFPPQVVGESMDKPNRLEIVDYPELTNPTLPEEPAGVARPIDRNGNPRAVQFRLTPSGEIWIRPSDVERGYFLPEWASHEIFRQRGDLGIGAAMAGMRGEFLYGLSVGVDPARELGAARSARVAEIEALTGRPPRQLGVSNLSTSIATRWKALDRVIARRPERIESWARDVNSTVPFAPAKFTNGVSFALRQTALHARPLPLESSDPNNLDQLDQPGSGRPRVSAKGLTGGALWPIEQRNFFNALLERPASQGGTIEQIALSPIGGDANQTAEFLNQKVRIISETRNGFVQRHKVEIIGRIGVFWHWAKHVVVYERTVNPSAQFTPDGGIGNRTRRPVLRKVSEYIYIRQPQGIRRYPDFTTAEPSSSGLLKAVKFNSITINVDSAWSEDVGTYGWKVPLWNRDAARRRPQVYPRPDIGFSTFAEGQGEEAEATQECLEPDNIYFYADASPETDPDTDTWPSLVGIDCSALPPPSHQFQREFDPLDSGSKPSAPRIPRGHRRFTWRLAPPSKKTKLNAGRSDQPLFASLESITFMRSNVPDNQSAGEELRKAMANADKLKAPRPDERLTFWEDGSKAPIDIDAFEALANFRAAVTKDPYNKDEVKAKAKALSNALKNVLAGNEKEKITKAITTAMSFKSTLENIAPYLPDSKSRCQKMADDLVGSIRRKELLIVDAVRTWEADAENLIPTIKPKDLEVLKKDLVATLTKRVAQSLGGFTTDIGRLNLGKERALGILREFENDIRQIEDNTEEQLRTLTAAYDNNKPWSQNRLENFETMLADAGKRALGMIQTAVEEATGRLSTELDDAAQRIGNALHDAMLAVSEAVSKEESELRKEIDKAWNLVGTYFDVAIKRLDELLSKTNGKDISEQFDEQLREFKNKLGNYPEKTHILEAVRTRLPFFPNLAIAIKEKLNNIIKQTNPPVRLVDLVKVAADAAESVITELTEIVDQTAGCLTGLKDDVPPVAVAEMRNALTKYNEGVTRGISIIRNFGTAIDSIVDSGIKSIRETLNKHLFSQIDDNWLKRLNETAEYIDRKLSNLTGAFKEENIVKLVTDKVIAPAIDSTFAEMSDALLKDYDNARKRLLILVRDTSTNVLAKLQGLTDEVLGDTKNEIINACTTIAGGVSDTLNYISDMENKVKEDALRIAGPLVQDVNDVIENADKLTKLADGIASDVRQINNDIATSYASARGYTDRVLEAAGNLGSGGIGAAPGNILRLYAAAASAPSLPNLEFQRDRLGYYYKQLDDIIDTTPVEAWFGRLGDELKALGLSIPFKKIGDRILPDDMSNFDISRIFKNFSGMKLDKLFKGYKLPPGAKDAIKVTHAFDKAQTRAWVQIDVDLPMREPKALFSVGPFELDFVDSRFAAIVRLEASKDSDKVDQIGRAVLTTNVDAVVSGQSMVSLQRVAVRYERSTGLHVEFDPKNIKLNPVFQFVQDTLGAIFPNEIGGMKVIKDRGAPIGVEHEFAMPPISLAFATSGITNILINNRFALVAFPDFVISNRFSLSKPELPFIFSIFVIGGTGYITVDTEYRPLANDGLMVVVEAAAGGSAQLAFAFGPVSGTVFITLSVALAYRKVFGQAGGGLTVSLVLVIAGNVDVAGIAVVYIGLLLRMSYRDSGAIDATGTLTVTIRISRFFEISVRANVQYQLRGGQSKATTSVSSDSAITDERVIKAKEKADKLLKARG